MPLQFIASVAGCKEAGDSDLVSCWGGNQVESGKTRTKREGLEHMISHVPGISRGVRHRDGGYDNPDDDGEVLLWGGGQVGNMGGLQSWELMRHGQLGQAHKTQVSGRAPAPPQRLSSHQDCQWPV